MRVRFRCDVMRIKHKLTRLPWAFLLAAVVFVGGQFALINSKAFWRFVLPYCKPNEDDAFRFEGVLRTIEKETPFRKVFVFGSSQARQDFDVAALNEEFKDEGLVFYNLGVPGTAQPLDLVMYADEILAKKPDVVIYMPFVESFYQPYYGHGSNQPKFRFDMKVLPVLMKYWTPEDWKAMRFRLMMTAISKPFPLFKYRDSLLRVAKKAIDDRLLGRPVRFSTYPITQRKGPDHFLAALVKEQGKARCEFSRHTLLARELFEDFLARMEDAGVEVIVVPGPVHPLYTALYDPAINEDFDAYFRRLSRRHRLVYLSYDEQPHFFMDEFMDFTHLDDRGREKFNRFLISRLTPVFEDIRPSDDIRVADGTRPVEPSAESQRAAVLVHESPHRPDASPVESGLSALSWDRSGLKKDYSEQTKTHRTDSYMPSLMPPAAP